MTESELLSRPEQQAKAVAWEVARNEVAAPCRTCFADEVGVRLVELRGPPFPPALPSEEWDLERQERLVICATCISAGARVLGLFRSPNEDRDVQKLRAALDAAEERLQGLLRDTERLDDQIAGLS